MNAIDREPWRGWVAANRGRGVAEADLLRIMRAKGFSDTGARRCLSDAGPDRAATVAAHPPREEREALVASPSRVPGAVRIDVPGAELFGYADFLADRECLDLIELIRDHSYPSAVAGASDFRSPARTSRTCDLGDLDHPLAKDIDRRLCRLLGIPAEYAETVQGQWYERGQHFDVHHDYFHPGTPGFDRHVGDRGQRTWTAMVFLNTPRAGGATSFPRLNVRFPARAGTVLMWNNLDGGGRPNPLTLHQGLPVESGCKAILTKWFRTGSDAGGLRSRRSPGELVEARTREGSLTLPVPGNLHEWLTDRVRRARPRKATTTSGRSRSGTAGRSRSDPIALDDGTKGRIAAALHRTAESWIGDLLAVAEVSDVRIHGAGDVEPLRRDEDRSRIVHAALCIDADPDAPWPYLVEDHRYRCHERVLAPGEMLLHEGARLLHGRPHPLCGRPCLTVSVSWRRRDDAAPMNDVPEEIDR